MKLSIKKHKEFTLSYQESEIKVTANSSATRLTLPNWSIKEFNQLCNLLDRESNYEEIVNTIESYPIMKRYQYRNTINYLFGNRVVYIDLSDNGKKLGKIKATSVKGKCLTGSKHPKSKSINKTTTIRKEDDNWVLEDSHGYLRLEWESKDKCEFFNLASSLLNEEEYSLESNSSGSYDCILRNLLKENNFFSLVNSEWYKYWDYHDLIFDAMTRHHADHIKRGGDYRFKPLECEEKADMEVLTETIAYHNQSNGPPYSQRITIKSGAMIKEKELTELFRRSFVNIREDGIGKDINYGMVHRPYPSAGNVHELRYFLMHIVDGIDNRIKMKEFSPSTGSFKDEQLMPSVAYENFEYMQKCWQESEVPRYMLIIVSDFPVISYKYRSIAYRLTLINTGCALSSFYKACKSMDIGCCAAGTGLSENIVGLLNSDRYKLVPTMEVGFGKSI